MSHLVEPHGGALKPLMPDRPALEEARARARRLKQAPLTTRERDDLIMMGIGAFSPLEGFFTRDDWRGVCDEMKTGDGTFWPIPITFSASADFAASLAPGEEIALVDPESGEAMGAMAARDRYEIDRRHECLSVFKTDDPAHPGVAKVMAQREVNLGGPVTVFSEGGYPEKFKGLYATPAECRALFEERGWRRIAALQLRNPMHRSHEYLAKIALEVSDGVFIHQLIGALKADDIPAEVRVRCVDALVRGYFPAGRVIQKGYPLEMRYAGPREALLHAVFRQNYGASHLIVGRDHAGVGKYYGPFDAQKIFDEIPEGALKISPLKIDWTFYCYKCGEMSSAKTCPHEAEYHLLLSGTRLRQLLCDGGEVPRNFSRPEVLDILREYYQGLDSTRKDSYSQIFSGTGI
ncbi:MAG: sulfate adenylyltransferase [Candidatus Sumerlaeota bacterium]|nr:sulfate adenylyltransferase [Candidatus Sumerlaeota bacterium]